MHHAELAAWILGTGTSAAGVLKARRWSPEWWASVAALLCCLALVGAHA
jgi:hypothetical protein